MFFLHLHPIVLSSKFVDILHVSFATVIDFLLPFYSLITLTWEWLISVYSFCD